MFGDIFARVEQAVATGGSEYVLEVSMMEIYLERVFDLLNNRMQRSIRGTNELGFFVEKLTKKRVKTFADVAQVLKSARAQQSVASTACNDTSSRAHTILEVHLRKLLSDEKGGPAYARITIVDLAGSENVKQSAVSGEKLMQASIINLSLMELGKVVERVVDQDIENNSEEPDSRRHGISCRGSSLTKLLMDSLGGNSK
eukprot:Sspe_Gene.119890::Locus_117091_Transcript_1_1_Confidence_1.000_Length_599::g.119890::m.119890